MDAMLSSLNLPIFGYPLKRIDGDYYIDGGISNNHPRIDKHTVLSTPFRTVEHAFPATADDAEAPKMVNQQVLQTQH